MSDVSLDSTHMTRRHWTDKGGFQMIAIIETILHLVAHIATLFPHYIIEFSQRL